MTRRRGERGSGTILVAAASFILVAGAWVALWVISWIDCGQRADSVADLAASAAAQARAVGHDACTVASSVALANGGRVVSCRVNGNATSFDVRVVVDVPLLPRVPGSPERVQGSATAGTLL